MGRKKILYIITATTLIFIVVSVFTNSIPATTFNSAIRVATRAVTITANFITAITRFSDAEPKLGFILFRFDKDFLRFHDAIFDHSGADDTDVDGATNGSGALKVNHAGAVTFTAVDWVRGR